MAASDPFTPETPEQAKNPDKNYLFDDFIARVARGPVQWHLLVTIGQPGDVTSDPTIPWPAERERVDVGTLTINHVETEAPGNCRDINFDPLVLPAGIEPSDDPILSARSATYSQSFTRREGEKKTPSAVQVPVRQRLMTMTPHRPFPVFSRILHWTMAVLVLAMLFIGIGMVSSVSAYHQLVAIHKPLGILVLVLVAIRLVNRLVNPPPPLPEGMPPWQRVAALGSHVLLYILMFAVPIVGWAMLSAARYPVVLYGALQLPPIMPQNPELFAVLRETHTVLALLLFVTFLAHFGAALMHALIFRDDVFPSMTFWGLRNERVGGISGDRDGRAQVAAAPALAKSE